MFANNISAWYYTERTSCVFAFVVFFKAKETMYTEEIKHHVLHLLSLGELIWVWATIRQVDLGDHF
jgi:hypothetical protein